ncbi:actin-histidine N-methyltransferase-like [Dendronephthya gigantea]|uniref:actin-histidine N-methyltransferase-like n=1 Tax=Dendronephthya gigantea TaxID=151771 RepID=UPI001069ADEB|nr:actin-histidine N-methyltransferase-like [Dendronephthya gigantea]XP_028404427.1 actin-histidine N-methyltransferase-like [Dendronephthya gigantea]
MGKKNRTNKDGRAQKSKPEEDATVSLLLEKASSLPAANAKEQWDEHVAIRELVDKIQKMQVQSEKEEVPTRSTFLPKFSEWLKENKADSENVEVYSSSEVDCGVRAVTSLQAGEKILNIPRKLILTSEHSTSTFLGSIIETDKLLQVMPNVVLALKLLNECHKEDSFWKPYIDILPLKFSIPLFFTQEEVSVLKGSQVLGNVLNLYKSIARQYAYLYQLFKKIPTNNKLSFMKSFTYNQYRWAVSIVMTRQNQIPCSSGKGLHLALIPFLDMCNHCEGHFTTDYDLSTDSCVCYALDSYVSGDQVFIFYGPRSNSDFFVHSGFYYTDNKHDLLHIKLGISSSDSLHMLKTQLLSKIGVNMKNLAVTKEEIPLTKDLLAFLRIFCVTEDEGKQLSEKTAEELQTILFDHSVKVSKENEEKLCSFLETRCSLLLRQYPTTKEQDDEVLDSNDLSENTRLAITLRRNEKTLLLNALSFCKETKEQL